MTLTPPLCQMVNAACFAAAKMAHVEPEEKAASRPLHSRSGRQAARRTRRTWRGRPCGSRRRAPRRTRPRPKRAAPAPALSARSCCGFRPAISRKSPSPATKPERKPGRLERLDSELKTTRFLKRSGVASATADAPVGGSSRVDLRIALVEEQHEVVAARERERAGGYSRRWRRRPAGWPASTGRTPPCAAECPARCSSASRSGRWPVSAVALRKHRLAAGA